MRQKRDLRRYPRAETGNRRPRHARNGRKNGLSACEQFTAGFGRLGGGRIADSRRRKNSPAQRLWLVRPPERGVYVLTEAGRAALKRWPQYASDVSAAVVRIRRCMVGLPYQFRIAMQDDPH